MKCPLAHLAACSRTAAPLEPRGFGAAVPRRKASVLRLRTHRSAREGCRRILLRLSSKLQRLLCGSLGSPSSYAGPKAATPERLLSLKLLAHQGKVAIPSRPGASALPLDLWLFSHGLSSHPHITRVQPWHFVCLQFIPTCSWPWR